MTRGGDGSGDAVDAADEQLAGPTAPTFTLRACALCDLADRHLGREAVACRTAPSRAGPRAVKRNRRSRDSSTSQNSRPEDDATRQRSWPALARLAFTHLSDPVLGSFLELGAVCETADSEAVRIGLILKFVPAPTYPPFCGWVDGPGGAGMALPAPLVVDGHGGVAQADVARRRHRQEPSGSADESDESDESAGSGIWPWSGVSSLSLLSSPLMGM